MVLFEVVSLKTAAWRWLRYVIPFYSAMLQCSTSPWAFNSNLLSISHSLINVQKRDLGTLLIGNANSASVGIRIQAHWCPFNSKQYWDINPARWYSSNRMLLAGMRDQWMRFAQLDPPSMRSSRWKWRWLWRFFCACSQELPCRNSGKDIGANAWRAEVGWLSDATVDHSFEEHSRHLRGGSCSIPKQEFLSHFGCQWDLP